MSSQTDSAETAFADRYGPWAIVAGASDGTGAACARSLARRGVRVVLVARRREALEALSRELPTETRVLQLDLSSDGAAQALHEAVSDLEVGFLFYNAGADTAQRHFVDCDERTLVDLIVRNCSTLTSLTHIFGRAMVGRGRGGVVLVSSWGGLNGVAGTAVYSATKAFDLVLAESLWAEWRPLGVEALALVLGATDTPHLRRMLADRGGDFGELADPTDVVEQGLAHLGRGPTWIVGAQDPAGASPMGDLPRRTAVELMSAAAASMDA